MVDELPQLQDSFRSAPSEGADTDIKELVLATMDNDEKLLLSLARYKNNKYIFLRKVEESAVGERKFKGNARIGESDSVDMLRHFYRAVDSCMNKMHFG